MRDSPDVLVLGAGFAGLACATALAQDGASVGVLEASGTPGGRAGSFAEPRTGERLDLGPHLLAGANRDALALLERLGTRDGVQFQRSLSIDYLWAGNRHGRLSCPPLPAPLHLLAGLLRFRSVPLSERVDAVRLGRAALRAAPGREAPSSSAPRENSLAPEATETVSQWLERLRQGSGVRRLLWEPLATAALNEVPERAAASLFARVLAEIFTGGRRASALGWPRRSLRDLLEPASGWLQRHGGSLTCSSPAARVEWRGSRVEAVRLRDGRRLRSRQLVSAVPARVLGELIDAAPAAAQPLQRCCRLFASRTTPILSVYFWSDRRLLEAPFCALPGQAFPWIFERRTHSPGSRHSWLVALCLSGARGWMERSNDDILQICADQLEQLFPDSRRHLWHARVVRQPAATFEPAPELCSQRPGPVTPIDNLYLAGDWTDTQLPSTLEGAARSGHAAAKALRARI